MDNPQLSWYVVEDSSPVPYEEYYAGSYRPDDTLLITMQVWNNRWGQADVNDISNGNLVVFFDTLEDASLLDLCSVKIDSNDYVPLTVTSGRGRVSLGRVLSGKSNTGSSTSTGNYAVITLQFGPVTSGLRNSLKNLFLDIEFDT